MFAASDYLDFSHTAHASLFDGDSPVWAVLARIDGYLKANLKPEIRGTVHPLAYVGENVFIDEGTTVEAGAHIKGPAWIGKNCLVRTGCYVRENVITGDHCVLGNSCEFKNCVVFDNCEVPHYNYVGDAVLGYKAHLGAGVILSNVRLDRGEVTVNDAGAKTRTGLLKFSAIIGDHAEIGCNSVINPGSLIGRHSVLHPLANFSGVLPAETLLKVRQAQERVPRTRAAD